MPHQPTQEQVQLAALKIQNAYRNHQTQLNLKYKQTWEIKEKLDNSIEQAESKLRRLSGKLFNSSQAIAPSILRALDSVRAPAAEHELFILTNPDYFIVPYDYQGPRIEGHISHETLVDLIEAFRRGQVLHEHYVFRILHQGRNILRALSNSNYIDLTRLNHVFVIGDLHGQLSDLLHIFKENGLPTCNNPYLFNGNLVGHGSNSLEVFLLFMVTLILNPTSVFVNRGNHEDPLLTIHHGLQAEIILKYKTRAKSLLVLFKEIFSWLPLYSIINTEAISVMAVHGGISDRVHLSQITRLDRRRYVTLCMPPSSKKLGSSLTEQEQSEYQQVQDLLWSDPLDDNGCYENHIKGAGYMFGKDVAKQFLKDRKLSMMICSHQMSEKGVETYYDGELMTVFSASNYRDGSNFGGFLRWDRYSREPWINTYKSVPMDTENTSLHDKIILYEDSVYQLLLQRILSSRAQLQVAFKTEDDSGTNHLPTHVWAQIMTNVVQLDLPWQIIRSKLVKEDSNGILYNSMFEEYKLEHTKVQDVAPDKMEELYRWKDSLIMMFNLIDRDLSGYINRVELADIIQFLQDDDAQNDDENSSHIYEMCSTMDIEKNGRIDVREFFEGFRLVRVGAQENKQSENKSLEIAPDAKLSY